MAELKSDQITNLDASPPTKLGIGLTGGRLRCWHGSITLAIPGSTDTFVFCRVPRGFRFAYGVLVNSVAGGGTATLAIGLRDTDGGGNADPDALRAAATKNTVTPEVFGIEGTGVGTKQSAAREVYGTSAAAALADGVYRVMIFGTVD